MQSKFVTRSLAPRLGRLAAAATVAIAAAAAIDTASAADGEILITQAKALAGNVTAGDTPGFPITLSASGAYRLAGNLQIPAGKNGILVAASHVSIDLNGFQIAGGTVGLNGIAESGTNRSGVTVRNGVITGFRLDGIRGTGQLWTVEDMRIWFNGRNGVSAGHLLQLRDSALYINGLNGVVSINWTLVSNSTVVGSGANGVVCENHCLIQGSMISQNGIGASGGVGVSADLGTVIGNTISGNQGFGISGSFTGYGNNTLVTNNNAGGGAQVSNELFPMQPNACSPAC